MSSEVKALQPGVGVMSEVRDGHCSPGCATPAWRAFGPSVLRCSQLPRGTRNTQFGIPLPHDTRAQCLGLRKRKEAPRGSKSPRAAVLLSGLGRAGASAAFGQPSSASPNPAPGQHLCQPTDPWPGGTGLTRAVWVSSLGSCHGRPVCVSGQDVGRCFLC